MAVDYTEQTKLAKIMERVQMLLARADHPNTPPAEAELSRQRADKLMLQYKIEALTAPQAKDLNAPVWADAILSQQGSEWTHFYAAIAEYAARFTGCRSRSLWEKRTDDEGRNEYFYVMHFVGFEGDVRYVEMLIATALKAFGDLLEPKFNPKETHAENALRLRKGGMERRRIAEVLFGKASSVNEQKGFNRRVTTMIKQEAARQGEPHLAAELLGRGNNIKTYRESYASGFYNTLVNRMQKLAADRAAYSSGELVLASYKERVDEAFYERYPNLRPQPVKQIGEASEECAKCRRSKSGYCRDHSYLRPRSSRASSKPYSQAGARAGRAAAQRVDLGGPARRIGG